MEEGEETYRAFRVGEVAERDFTIQRCDVAEPGTLMQNILCPLKHSVHL